MSRNSENAIAAPVPLPCGCTYDIARRNGPELRRVIAIDAFSSNHEQGSILARNAVSDSLLPRVRQLS